jgi:thiosulfate reductase cytochrome b subunit
MSEPAPKNSSNGHRWWVRISHWTITLAFFGLVFTGIEILMVHPRLYWGEVGNDLTPALIELPISRNYKHGGWDNSMSFDNGTTAMSASRTYQIFNQNGWGRSLHFLLAWVLVITGVLYLVAGALTGHFRRRILPTLRELNPVVIYKDLMAHLKFRQYTSTPSQYNLSQRLSYAAVIFWLFPVMLITGSTMSPAVTASFPFLLDWTGGLQSARTIHFLASVLLELFLIVHFTMVIITGFRKQIIAMTIAK